MERFEGAENGGPGGRAQAALELCAKDDAALLTAKGGL